MLDIDRFQRILEAARRKLSFRQDITVLPADDPSKVKIGWKVYEEKGVVVINDYGTSFHEANKR